MEYLEVKVIENMAGIALLCGQVAARGELLVCDRCSDPGQTIAAILTVGPPEGPSFAVCGPCFQVMPQGAIIT
jgi:hypothetical protein